MHVVVIGLCLQRRRPHHRITRPAASSLPRTSPRNNRPSNIEHGNRPSNVGLAFGPVGDRWPQVVRVKIATGDVAIEFPFAGHSTTVSNHCKRNFEHPRSTAQLLCPITADITGNGRKTFHFKNLASRSPVHVMVRRRIDLDWPLAFRTPMVVIRIHVRLADGAIFNFIIAIFVGDSIGGRDGDNGSSDKSSRRVCDKREEAM